MAKVAKLMAKTMIYDKSSSPDNFDCEFLIHQRRRLSKKFERQVDIHSFWQLELIYKGRQRVKSEGREYKLKKDTLLLLPPNTPHEFCYNGRETAWLSIKFKTDFPADNMMRIVDVNTIPVVSLLCESLTKSLPDKSYIPAHTRTAINYILGALMTNLFFNFNTAKEVLTISEEIGEYVKKRQGRRVSVKEIAEEFGYSSAYLPVLFKKVTGESLKNFVDRERINFARNLLLYSDLNITEVAKKLDFPDLYAFSRFFRNHIKLSPKKFREQSFKKSGA